MIFYLSVHRSPITACNIACFTLTLCARPQQASSSQEWVSKNWKFLWFSNVLLGPLALTLLRFDKVDELMSLDFAEAMDRIEGHLDMRVLPTSRWFFSTKYSVQEVDRAKSFVSDNFFDVSSDLPDLSLRRQFL